jgi:hypothetical protein
MSRDLLVRVTSFAALESNGRFSCRVATTKVQQPQNIPRCVRTQQDLNTSPMGSFVESAAFQLSGCFDLGVGFRALRHSPLKDERRLLPVQKQIKEKDRAYLDHPHRRQYGR